MWNGYSRNILVCLYDILVFSRVVLRRGFFLEGVLILLSKLPSPPLPNVPPPQKKVSPGIVTEDPSNQINFFSPPPSVSLSPPSSPPPAPPSSPPPPLRVVPQPPLSSSEVVFSPPSLEGTNLGFISPTQPMPVVPLPESVLQERRKKEIEATIGRKRGRAKFVSPHEFRMVYRYPEGSRFSKVSHLHDKDCRILIKRTAEDPQCESGRCWVEFKDGLHVCVPRSRIFTKE